MSTPQPPSPPSNPPALHPMVVESATILAVGTAIWAVALLLTLLVPALHAGTRDWWPWCCVVGVVGGSLAFLYVRRGRGNAVSA